MKSDAAVRQDVLEELSWDPRLLEKEIGIAVKDGVVTLSGFVRSFAEKYAAGRAVERVAGVRALADELEVRLADAYARTDQAIAHEVADALRRDIQVPDDRITAKVAAGWVTLEGRTDWQYQKEAAFRAIRNLAGVRGVTNAIAVAPAHVSTFDVSQRIRDSLRRHAEQEAARITVEAHDGEVVLRGKVNSWRERHDAENAAWSAPGVTNVVDQLAIHA